MKRTGYRDSRDDEKNVSVRQNSCDVTNVTQLTSCRNNDVSNLTDEVIVYEDPERDTQRQFVPGSIPQ